MLLKQLRNDGISYFQENKHDHKHLFVCSNCTKSIVLDNCPLEDLLNSLEKQEGFEIKAHNIELYGLCKNCLGLKKSIIRRIIRRIITITRNDIKINISIN